MMQSRRNVFARQGGNSDSPGTFKRQASLRNAFKQTGGSIRNLFQSPKSVNSKDTTKSRRLNRKGKVLTSLKEHMNENNHQSSSLHMPSSMQMQPSSSHMFLQKQQQQHQTTSEHSRGMGKSTHTHGTMGKSSHTHGTQTTQKMSNTTNPAPPRRRKKNTSTHGTSKHNERSTSKHSGKNTTKKLSTTSNHNSEHGKKKKKNRRAKTKKTKEVASSPNSPGNSSEDSQFKHWWQKHPDGESSSSSKHNKRSKKKKSSGSKHGKSHQPQPSPKISPKTYQKCVMVDMAGAVNLDATTDSQHTHTETTHDTIKSFESFACSSPKPVVVRKISSDNGAYKSPKRIPEDGYPSEEFSTPSRDQNSRATGRYSYQTTDDDVSILSEADFSEQIMEDLSCALDDEDEDENQEEHDDFIVEEEDEIYEEEIIEDDYDEYEEEERSYVDLYCPNMKRISDLTGATGAFTMSSLMYDEDDDLPLPLSMPTPTSSKSKIEIVSPITPITRSSVDLGNKGRLMSRISELTEASMYENFDIFDEDEDDANYDCSSIVSNESGPSFVQNRKPISYYSTSNHQRIGNCGIASPGTPTNPKRFGNCGVASPGTPTNPAYNKNRNNYTSKKINQRSSVSSDSSSTSFVKDRKPMSFYSMSGREDANKRAITKANAMWNDSFSSSQPSPASTYRSYKQPISDLSSSYCSSTPNTNSGSSSSKKRVTAPRRVSWHDDDNN